MFENIRQVIFIVLNSDFIIMRIRAFVNFFKSLRMQNKFAFGTTQRSKAKRIKELSEAKITFEPQQTPQPQKPSIDYAEGLKKLRQIDDWTSLPFDELCNLDSDVLKVIQLETKKDKFNVDDQEFYAIAKSQKGNKEQYFKKLNLYYQRMYSLLTSDFGLYDSIKPKIPFPEKYLHQIYVMDLQNQKLLLLTISQFLININNPSKLQNCAQPTFIKHLLSIKRELILQGIIFEEEQKVVKKSVQKSQKISKLALQIGEEESTDDKEFEALQKSVLAEIQQLDAKKSNPIPKIESNEQQKYQSQPQSKSQNIPSSEQSVFVSSKFSFKIVEILRYDYEFWVDIAHNRSKNCPASAFIVQSQRIANPNTSILYSPQIDITYVARKKKHKDYEMNFCIKCELEIQINDKFRRRVKVEWKGPSNKHMGKVDAPTKYIVIDYEGIMNGNPTIKPVFTF